MTGIEAGVFALSVAVGLTPEMLPMIITATVAKGLLSWSKKELLLKTKCDSRFRGYRHFMY